MDVYKGKIPTIWYFAFKDREIDLIVEALEMLKVDYVKYSEKSVSCGDPDGYAKMFSDISCEIDDLKMRFLKMRGKEIGE